VTPLYFAYGSNLCSARLRGRVPSAEVRGVAFASGFTLRLDKRGADGSGKANLHRSHGGRVWGVVYALDAADWPLLDACEPGYARIGIAVSLGDRQVAVQTYRSDHITASPVGASWYKQLILDGAREHGLPPEWCAALQALPAR